MPKKSSKSKSLQSTLKAKSQDLSQQTSEKVSQIRERLEGHRDQAVQTFHEHHPEAADWLKSKSLDLSQIRLHSQKLLTGASLSSALLLAAPTSPKVLPQKPAQVRLAQAGITSSSGLTSSFLNKLKPLIPDRIGHLDPDQESKATKLLYETFAIKASSTLDDQRLNHSLGWIGYEQHLKRFPGDSLYQHDAELQAGIAPGRGAWGYFASSRSQLTPELTSYEKYYVAVQTMYLADWGQNTKALSDWYKYRKVIVVNTDTGEAVVAVIADAGPAAWTGKQFGGSPEVMRALDLTGKKSKGKVLLYFVDDSDGKIPVGPLKGKIGEDIQLT